MDRLHFFLIFDSFDFTEGYRVYYILFETEANILFSKFNYFYVLLA